MNQPSPRPLARRAAVIAALLGLGTGGAVNADNGALFTLPGQTPLQQATSTPLQNVCLDLTAPTTPPPAPGSNTARLINSCSRMVASASFAQPDPILGLAAFNLNLTNEQVRTGVQAIAPVQANAQKQISTEASKMNTIGTRLLAVRGGARGVVLGVNGEETTVAAEGSEARPATAAGRGGAAGPDDAFGGPWGGFVNIAYAWGNVDTTSLQDGYKYGAWAILAGADYRVSDSLVLGAAFSYSDTKSDYDNSLGDVKAATTGVIGYGTWYKDDWYVDGFLAYGSVGYDTTRIIVVPSNNPAFCNPAQGVVSSCPINATATASPEGDQWSAGIGIGKNFASGGFSITPTARLGYIWVKNKAFSETENTEGLALAVDERTIKSLQSALGVRIATTVSTASGVFGPYINAQWLHEFENDAPSIVSKYVSGPAGPVNQFAIPTADPTRDYAILAVGSSATFPNNLTGFFQFSAALGLDNETNYGVVLGLRKQF